MLCAGSSREMWTICWVWITICAIFRFLFVSIASHGAPEGWGCVCLFGYGTLGMHHTLQCSGDTGGGMTEGALCLVSGNSRLKSLKAAEFINTVLLSMLEKLRYFLTCKPEGLLKWRSWPVGNINPQVCALTWGDLGWGLRDDMKLNVRIQNLENSLRDSHTSKIPRKACDCAL